MGGWSKRGRESGAWPELQSPRTPAGIWLSACIAASLCRLAKAAGRARRCGLGCSQASCGLQVGARVEQFAGCHDISANVSTGYSLFYSLSDNGNGTSTLSGAMERPVTAPAWIAFGLPACPDCGMSKGSAVVAKTDAASPTGMPRLACIICPNHSVNAMPAQCQYAFKAQVFQGSLGTVAQVQSCRSITWAATARQKWCPGET